MSFKSYLSAFVGSVAALMGFTACQDDVDAPSFTAPVATIEANTSILDLKTKYWNNDANYIDTVRLTESGEHVVIAGRVVSSDKDGNIYKNLVIQDGTAALTLSINANSLYTSYPIGQEVVVDVTDMYIGKYSSLQQLGFPDYATGYGWQATFMPYEFFRGHAQLNGLPQPEKIDTLLTTIDKLSKDEASLRQWQSQLIRLNNVHFEEGGEATFCTEHKVNTNRTLVDDNGNTIIVRTSGYARFWSTMLPAEKGDVVGILSYNGSGSSANWQILLRSTDDLMNFGNPTLPVGTEENPYSIIEAVAFADAGKNMTAWTSGYIVGAVKAELTEVKSDSDIEWGAPTEMNNTIIIGQTADTRSLDEALLVQLPQNSKLREMANLRDNPEVYGKQILIYGTFAKDMGTFAITNNQGTLNEFRIDGVEAGGAIPNGSGTEASPYSAAQVNAMGTSASQSNVYVKGYIVGWIDNSSQTYGDEKNCMFSVPATVPTNILIANTPDEQDYSKCVAVNLPSGDIRKAINLVDNPANLGKWVVVKGNIIKYFALPGVKDVTAYTLQGGSAPENPDTPVTPADPVTSLNVNFDGVTSINQLTGWSVETPSGNKPWFFREMQSNYRAECTAFGSNAQAGADGFVSWLITPPLNVAGMSEKVISFKTIVGYSGNGTLEVFAMTTPDPATATLTPLSCTIPQPTGQFGDWVPSGNISLSQFSGNIYIGFRYKAAEGSSYTTYAIDDVVAGSSSSTTTPDTPDTPDTPELTGDGTQAKPYTPADLYKINPKDSSLPANYAYGSKWVEGVIVGTCTSSVISSATFSAENASDSNIILGPSADCKDISQCVVVQLPTKVRDGLSLKRKPEMLGKTVELQGDILKYFGGPGVKNISEYVVK